VYGFIDHLYTPFRTTGNYSAIADLHTLQFTVTHTHTHIHTLVFSVFTSRILVTDLAQWRFFSFRDLAVARWLTLHTWTHSAIFSASPCRTQLSSNRSLGTPELNSLFSTEPFFITTLHEPNRKRRFQQYPYCSFTDPLLIKGFFCCCMRVHFRGNLFTEPLRSSELFRFSGFMSQ
jgi:hypothetical protein